MTHSYSHGFCKPEAFYSWFSSHAKNYTETATLKIHRSKNPKSFSSNTLQTMHKVLIYTYAFLPNILPKCFIFYESLLELKKHTVFNTEIFRHCSKIVRAKEQYSTHTAHTLYCTSRFNVQYRILLILLRHCIPNHPTRLYSSVRQK